MKAVVVAVLVTLAGGVQAEDQGEELRLAVDRALAMVLVDPTDVIGYEVGGLVPCGDLARRLRREERQCVCYAFNSRNRAGGYSGKALRFGVAAELSSGQFIVADAGEVEARGSGLACAGSGMVQRDGSKIAEQVR